MFHSTIPYANIVLITKQNLEIKTVIPFGVLKDCVIPFEPLEKAKEKALRYEPAYRFRLMENVFQKSQIL